MRPHIRKLSSHFRSKPATARQKNRGYALLILMMVVTVLLVSLTAALPSVYQEGQRQREEELIFRGNEYARAIAFFHRRFNRYPTSVDELIRTNGIRFLRRRYPDPMTKDGKWRLIHVAANGALLNSRTLGGPGMTRGSLPGLSTSGAMGATSEDPARRPSGFSNTPDGQSGSSTSDRPNRARGGFVDDSKDTQGAFITGVASSSHKESIRVWKNHTHYDEWEFLGTEVNLGVVGVPGGRGPAGRPTPSPPGPPFGRPIPPGFPPDQNSMPRR